MLTDKVIAGYTDLPFVVNVINPTPILQQNKSSIVTNPFIPNEQREFELSLLDEEANEIIEKQYENTQLSSIKNQSIQQIFRNIANSVTDILDDVFKPREESVSLSEHLLNTFTKNQRYAYIGVLLIILAVIIKLLNFRK